MEIEILKGNHFCLFQGKEIGIAVNKYAANRFRDDYSEMYLLDTTSQDFGWIDSEGNYHIDYKGDMTRPTEEQTLEALKNCPELLRESVEKKLVKFV